MKISTNLTDDVILAELGERLSRRRIDLGLTQARVADEAGISKRTVERMRRGKLPIDARLDLHGSYQDAAQADLNAFIASCAASGCRTVLVITGKGSVREGGGVLRRRLPDWLNQPACRPHVLAFAGARPEHGGSGAFYVLLRRRRGNRP